MSLLVIDASFALNLLIPDESGSLDPAVKASLESADAFVPQIWQFEVRNGLLVAERRGRLSVGTAEARLASLERFQIATDTQPDLQAALALARDHTLTFYDALYLELAVRLGASLATLDAALLRACAREGVPVPTA